MSIGHIGLQDCNCSACSTSRMGSMSDNLYDTNVCSHHPNCESNCECIYCSNPPIVLNISNNSLVMDDAKVRKFETGGVRDLDKDKIDFEGFLSPLVIEEFGKYMHKHRQLLNGDFRASDNWQLGFGKEHFSVCMKSLWRHFFDLWKEHRGYKSRENIQDALNGILFNTMAYYHKLILQKNETD